MSKYWRGKAAQAPQRQSARTWNRPLNAPPATRPVVIARGYGSSQAARKIRARRRLALGGLLAALLVLGIGAYTWFGRVPAPVTAAADPVLVVWRPPGAAEAKLSLVPRDRWQNYVASRQDERTRSHQAIIATARAEMAAGLAPLFQDMKGRVNDYISWFYFFPTTYRFAFTSVFAVLSRDQSDNRPIEQIATGALNRLLQDRFTEVVVAPERFGPAAEAKAREVLAHAISTEQAIAGRETEALAAFISQNGRTAGEDEDVSGALKPRVVLSWEALGLPAEAAAMAAPPDPLQSIKNDPSLEPLQSSAGTEGIMLIARQIVRRYVYGTISNAAHDAILPMIAGGALGSAEVLVSPLLGAAAFGVGIGAEFSTIKARQAIEAPQMTVLAESVVDRLHDRQSQRLSDAVAERIGRWLGD